LPAPLISSTASLCLVNHLHLFVSVLLTLTNYTAVDGPSSAQNTNHEH
jgi:hypothetical protein